MTSATPLLKVSHLSTCFDMPTGIVRAVNDVSFSIDRGEILGIVGESGSGKSVTARSILRMVRHPGRIESGLIELEGRNLLDLPDEEMRAYRGKRIAMVFQDPQAALNPVMTVGAQIEEALRVHGADKATARARAHELLEQVGIPDVDRTISQYPHEFSGGMRQRVVIAIALANRAELLIADEPTTALDVTIQAQILRLLVDLRDELGVAIIMITHDMGVVAEMCDRVIVMYGGRVVETGLVRDLFETPMHPYAAALLSTVPRLSGPLQTQLTAIPGAPPDPADLPPGCAFGPRCGYVMERCSTEVPQLTALDATRAAACWRRMEEPTADLRPATVAASRRERRIEDVPALEVADLRVDVGSKRRGLLGGKAPAVFAVDGVTLSIRPGETLGLVGESGCGKSTLSRAIVGINPIASGSLTVGGREIISMNAGERRWVADHVQYVFQDPFASLNPRRTIGQSIEEALEVAGVPRSEIRERAEELLLKVGLDPKHLDRYPFAFSGGQRQRVGIARALAAKPRVLILDEPVSALDVSIQAQIINLLEQLRDELGIAYLFIAHDLSVVRHLSDRVAVMYLGRLVEVGTAEQVYGAPQHPYTRALLASSPEPEVDRERATEPVLQGDLPSPMNPPSGCRFRTRCPQGPAHRDDRAICAEVSPTLQITQTGQVAACHFMTEV